MVFAHLAVCVASVAGAAGFGEAGSLERISLRQLTTGERIFVDRLGRQRIFHGTNAVVKGPPWLPSRDGWDVQTSLVAGDFALMRAAGLNLLRLGVMWPGVEPSRGVYNQTYIELIRQIASEAASYGIYTLAEMHQDGLSERFCGEGVPAWAAQPDETLRFPMPFGAPFTESASDGFPTRRDCSDPPLPPSTPSYHPHPTLVAIATPPRDPPPPAPLGETAADLGMGRLKRRGLRSVRTIDSTAITMACSRRGGAIGSRWRARSEENRTCSDSNSSMSQWWESGCSR